MMKNLTRNWLAVSKLTEDIWRVLTRDTESLKIYTSMGCFWPKYIMFKLKRYKEVIFHDTRGWCKIWRKSVFGKLSPEHLKVWKLGLLQGPFIQSWKCMTLKFTGEWCVITMKNDAKIEEELTCLFKNGIGKLTNFDQSTQKSQTSEL